MPAGKRPISRTHSSSRDARVLSVVEEVLAAGGVGVTGPKRWRTTADAAFVPLARKWRQRKKRWW